MRCFVTGASGFIGANLVHELVARGHRVKALTRLESDLRGLKGADFERINDAYERWRADAMSRTCSPRRRSFSITRARPIAARRHFLQWFGWTPDTTVNPSSWTLGWTLIEVVDDQWSPITHEASLIVVNGSRPPASYDVGRLVQVRVNASGEAEFTITDGNSPRTKVIPPQGSR